ncbi:MAG: YabP/YqfC family sporulation protein [Acutalibacteraceae bacterium]
MNFKFKNKFGQNFSSEVSKADRYLKTSIVNSVHIEMKSNREMVIEGCKQIDEYDENVVKVKTPKMDISVFGRNIEIQCLNSDSLIISGVICSVEFST